MGIHIKEKQDYGYLFDSLNQGRKQTNNIFNAINLAEYHSIKSGAYGKAVSAYFDKMEVPEKEEQTVSKDYLIKDLAQDEKVRNLSSVVTNAEKLQKSAEKLITKGSDSLFRKENGDYDVEKIYQAVKDFVDRYNTAMDSLDGAGYKTIEQKVDDIQKSLSIYKDEMQSIGITVDDQRHKMGIIYDEFIKADMDAVRELFNGNTSMAYVVASKVSFAGAEAKNELNSLGSYNEKGRFDEQLKKGNLWNSFV